MEKIETILNTENMFFRAIGIDEIHYRLCFLPHRKNLTKIVVYNPDSELWRIWEGNFPDIALEDIKKINSLTNIKYIKNPFVGLEKTDLEDSSAYQDLVKNFHETKYLCEKKLEGDHLLGLNFMGERRWHVLHPVQFRAPDYESEVQNFKAVLLSAGKSAPAISHSEVKQASSSTPSIQMKEVEEKIIDKFIEFNEKLNSVDFELKKGNSTVREELEAKLAEQKNQLEKKIEKFDDLDNKLKPLSFEIKDETSKVREEMETKLSDQKSTLEQKINLLRHELKTLIEETKVDLTSLTKRVKTLEADFRDKVGNYDQFLSTDPEGNKN